MSDDAQVWIEKAEGDFEGAKILSSKRSKKVAHLACFACQQCAEKYLKAFLVEQNIHFSKTHALTRELLPLCESVDGDFRRLFKYLEILDPYSVQFRYPGEVVFVSEVRSAFNAAKLVRQFVRGKLGLESQRRLL